MRRPALPFILVDGPAGWAEHGHCSSGFVGQMARGEDEDKFVGPGRKEGGLREGGSSRGDVWV